MSRVFMVVVRTCSLVLADVAEWPQSCPRGTSDSSRGHLLSSQQGDSVHRVSEEGKGGVGSLIVSWRYGKGTRESQSVRRKVLWLSEGEKR